MIRAYSKALLALALLALPVAAQATIQTDPQVLYAQMKDAYAKGTAHGWTYRDQENYLSAIFTAGRAYAVQDASNPAYGEIARLVVQIGTGLHYNPLTNHDASAWYVREAAAWVIAHPADAQSTAQAKAIVERIDAVDRPQTLVRLADEDAAAAIAEFPHDNDVLMRQVEAEWRGWIITKDPSWRSLAFAHAAAANFPIANLPTTFGNDLLAAANAAAAGNDNYTSGDKANGQTIVARMKNVDPLRVIASVKSIPEDAYLTTQAPADEYFGRQKMSFLGMRNQLKHINFMLDYNYGNRESKATYDVAEAIDDMHKVYPRDRDVPQIMYAVYKTSVRMDDDMAKQIAAQMRKILTIEYPDTLEARQLLQLQ